MNIIDIVNDLLYNKDSEIYNDSNFYEVVPNNYLLQRWTSMTSINNIFLINETTNKLHNIYENDKVFLYKMLNTITDTNDCKIKYIKKPKEIVNEEETKQITKLANVCECSEREIKGYMSMVEK